MLADALLCTKNRPNPMPRHARLTVLLFFLPLAALSLRAQPRPADSLQISPGPNQRFFSLEPAATFDKRRFWISAGTGATIYTGVSVALWHAWYKDYPLTGFHTFNDMGEWMGLDKGGHLFSAFMESNYAFKGALWTGMERRKARWMAAGIGTGIQATIEVMDGFSAEWGFSWGDIAFNSLGVGLFFVQDASWQEQRILIKVSGIRPDYPTDPILSEDGSYQTNLDQRAAELYGTSPFQVILKDYNALTVWSSVNIHSFLKNRTGNRFPKWLNLAVGYGAGNVYGGFNNEWTTDDGAMYALDPELYPRYRQFYLSPDIDLTRIPSRHRWVKLLLGVLNWMKFPAPAFELNTQGKADFHWMHW